MPWLASPRDKAMPRAYLLAGEALGTKLTSQAAVNYYHPILEEVKVICV